MNSCQAMYMPKNISRSRLTVPPTSAAPILTFVRNSRKRLMAYLQFPVTKTDYPPPTMTKNVTTQVDYQRASHWVISCDYEGTYLRNLREPFGNSRYFGTCSIDHLSHGLAKSGKAPRCRHEEKRANALNAIISKRFEAQYTMQFDWRIRRRGSNVGTGSSQFRSA
jgi:hypothetical protein